MKMFVLAFIPLLAMMAGCKTSYDWKSDVPKSLRTVSVPNFRNESDVTEMGVIVAQQILREFQREGTFKIAGHDDAAIEVQGIVKSASSKYGGGDRRIGERIYENSFTMKAEVSVIDRRSGRVLIDNRTYSATTSFVGGMDLLTDKRNASGRLAEDLASQVVDDVLSVQM